MFYRSAMSFIVVKMQYLFLPQILRSCSFSTLLNNQKKVFTSVRVLWTDYMHKIKGEKHTWSMRNYVCVEIESRYMSKPQYILQTFEQATFVDEICSEIIKWLIPKYCFVSQIMAKCYIVLCFSHCKLTNTGNHPKMFEL